MPEELTTASQKQIKIVPYPKIIFFWPIFVLSLIIGMLIQLNLFKDKIHSQSEGETVTKNVDEGSGAEGAKPSTTKKLRGNRTLGLIWMVVFALNLCVVSFEFNRIKFLATIMAFFTLVLMAFLANTHFEFFKVFGDVIRAIDIQANHTFYYAVSVILGILGVIVFISTRWNYWIVEHNMILHYHGFMGDVERFPAPNLRMSKEITDIFEYCLGLSGTLVLQPSNETRAIVLENVLGINRKEEAIKKLLGSLAVSIR